MTLEEKVGQLFVTYAYGQTADTTDPADVASNQAELGVANGKELIEKYHLGGVIYFAWSNNVANPPQIAGLSNGLQRVATKRSAAHPAAHQPPTRSTASSPASARRPPSCRATWRSAPAAATSDTYDAAQISGKELRAIGINQDFAPDADVNVNAQNPVIGVRSFGSDPTLVSSLVVGQRRGLPGRQRLRDGQALPGPR